jgi:hypothetical protein
MLAIRLVRVVCCVSFRIARLSCYLWDSFIVVDSLDTCK